MSVDSAQGRRAREPTHVSTCPPRMRIHARAAGHAGRRSARAAYRASAGQAALPGRCRHSASPRPRTTMTRTSPFCSCASSPSCACASSPCPPAQRAHGRPRPRTGHATTCRHAAHGAEQGQARAPPSTNPHARARSAPPDLLVLVLLCLLVLLLALLRVAPHPARRVLRPQSRPTSPTHSPSNKAGRNELLGDA